MAASGPARWRRSSRSVGHGACVEVGQDIVFTVVRDSRLDGLGPVLRFSRAAWAGFLAGVKTSAGPVPPGPVPPGTGTGPALARRTRPAQLARESAAGFAAWRARYAS